MSTTLRTLLVIAMTLTPLVAAASDHNGAPSPAAPQSPTRDAVLRRHAHASHESAVLHERPATGQDVWVQLLAGNRRFVAGAPAARSLVQTRRALVNGQHPGAIVLGCADSRVSPELVFDQGLGDLFVVRTAGNVADPVALGSIEYAAEHLHPKALVVLGHEKCGAVAAAVASHDSPSANLATLISKVSPALHELRERFAGDALVHHGVAANVQHSAQDVLEHSAIIRAAVARGELVLIKGVYDLESGEVVQLP